MVKKKGPNILYSILIVLGIVVLLGLILEYTGVTEFTALGEEPVVPPASLPGAAPSGALQTNVGEAATLNFSAYTGQWGGALSETSVNPTYTVVKNGETKEVDDASVTGDTGFSVGDTGELWITGAAAYLASGDSQTFSVMTATPNIRLEVLNVTSNTGGQITIRDENDDALTADDHGNNTADYAGGNIAAGQDVEYIVKFQQQTADRAFNLGAICTYYSTGEEGDDFRLTRTDSAKIKRYNPSTGVLEDVSNEYSGVTWSTAIIPKILIDATINAYGDNGANVTTDTDFTHCYEASKPIMLLENDWIKLVFTFEPDDSTQPVANNMTHFGGVFMDYACDAAKSGVTPYCGWVRWNDGTEDPGAIGLDEGPETTVSGLDFSFQVEAQ